MPSSIALAGTTHHAVFRHAYFDVLHSACWKACLEITALRRDLVLGGESFPLVPVVDATDTTNHVVFTQPYVLEEHLSIRLIP
jgi:hypothetical protein